MALLVKAADLTEPASLLLSLPLHLPDRVITRITRKMHAEVF